MSALAKRKKKELPPPVEQFGDKLVAKNRRASFDYALGDRYEAGMVLVGSEVKMLRNASADLSDCFVVIQSNEAWLHGLNIPELSGTHYGHPAKRKRKLLLHRLEIEQLKRAIDRDGMTAIATRLYFRGGRAKIEIALARGKRKQDKRETIKRRDADREAQADMDRARRRS
jgi:SsrA-binding protein